MDIPPVVPDIKSILDEYVSHPERLSIHQYKNNLRTCPVDRGDMKTQLFSFHRTQLPLIQQVKRDPQTGKILGHEEIEITSIGETAKNSLSLTRAPGPRNESLKGNCTNYPFWPGGFDLEKSPETLGPPIGSNDVEEEAWLAHELFEKDLLICPPGFDRGVDFDIPNETAVQGFKSDSTPVGPSLRFWQGKDKKDFKILNAENEVKASNKLVDKSLLKSLRDELVISSEAPKPRVLKIGNASSVLKSSFIAEWAEGVDISKPMTDFYQRVPDMAFKFEFELDNFQKQAVLHLEQHENVFVAAHTSAGKTAVAEYAIALSVRHMTRTIYTSPIKALSNQKFRDFKKNFESVGLVTGDVQINPTASCLIMTTEILRSMLYNGSDVIRDLEWVVFDEIHYLNNEERGHVWEEVLIMLPQHVSIIMLSATVPNALQFANWVGQIKKKKIYVISTSKRPVPLEHFLYTGSGGKSKNEQFLILDAAGNFSKKGYDEAKIAKESRLSKHKQQFGPKGGQRNAAFNENSEKTTYIGLISHLKEKEKLPVVIFTFSRNRIDTYSKMLSSVDLCTGAEKAEINGFFLRSVAKLSAPDRMLPQVLFVQEMLKSGIGVHHSGILPILKEVVEMLFQKGLVKLLFATETFAMGVNMPARTVVFDSFRKHDGNCFRNLTPAEYIQMAGRAGRRGLDTTGTVIILSKQGVPDMLELQAMMLGKAAKLESQFKVTYSMILNLLRVERLSVEDVLKRSFLEAGKEFKVEDHIQLKAKIEEKIKEYVDIQMDPKFVEFYKYLKNYFQMREGVMDYILTHNKITSGLVAGRVLILEDLPLYTARFGVVLNSCALKYGKMIRKAYNVLILTGTSEPATMEYQGLVIPDLSDLNLLLNCGTSDSLNRLFHRFIYYSHSSLIDFLPLSSSHPTLEHAIIQVNADNILEITEYQVHVDPFSATADVKKRELERFKHDRPVPSLLHSLGGLYKLTWDVKINSNEENPIRLVNFLTDMHFRDPAVMVKVDKFVRLKTGIKFIAEGFDKEKFKTQFHEVFRYMVLLDKRDHIDYMLSPESLQLHESYRCRIDVLQKMGYINYENLVQLKGRVACEMGNQNELMVTEIVLNNLLSDCAPEEIAALLSCMVFETKNVDEPKLDEHLGGKVEEIKTLARQIGQTQRDCGLIEPVEQYVEQFKFGLVEVVHEWSKGKPFAEIMRLTDVQEGLIVRAIQRLDEMIRDVKDAARIIGDPSLKKKMEEASQCIKRDIVFAASLYTQ